MTYFFYLIYLYFNNNITPKIVRKESISQIPIPIDIHEDFLAFSLIVNEKPLRDLEK